MPETPVKPDRPRYLFLDGLRGMAAVYVVVFHAKQRYGQADHPWTFRFTHAVDHFFDSGPYAVVMFIVLSGYCLMLPVAHNPDGVLRGGATAFARRRARRILPPYYAALALALALSCGLPSWFQVSLMRSPYTITDVLSHLFVVHNFFPRSILRIDPPMWSVATECDLYVLFPLLILPTFRSLGYGGVLALSIGFGVVPHLLNASTDALMPWMFTAFGFGAIVAILTQRPPRPAVPWARASIAFGVLTVAACLTIVRRRPSVEFIAVITFAAACASLIGHLASPSPSSRPSRLLRLLESRPVIFLGVMSYSLYLFHYPVIAMFSTMLVHFNTGPFAYWLLMITGGVIASVVCGYGFHRLFERPWMAHAPATLKAAAKVAVIDPAP